MVMLILNSEIYTVGEVCTLGTVALSDHSSVFLSFFLSLPPVLVYPADCSEVPYKLCEKLRKAPRRACPLAGPVATGNLIASVAKHSLSKGWNRGTNNYRPLASKTVDFG
jgi:hypothetical protein